MTLNQQFYTLSSPFGPDFTELPNVMVLGLGESGTAMAKWCLAEGASVKIHDTRTEDQLSKEVLENAQKLKELGVLSIQFGPEITSSELEGIQILAVSPGMSPLQKPMKDLIGLAQERGYQVWGELEFFSQALKSLEISAQYQAKVLAITGTNGKTTTTALTAAISARAGKRVAVAGNISPSLLDKLMECLSFSEQNETPEALISKLPEIWVLELSSFQLFYSQTFNPSVATVLNISQDHLDWHGDMTHYCESKAKIFGNDTIAVLNRDDSNVMGAVDLARLDKNRTITFGIDAPFEEDSFGIVGDMAAGGFDWLAWVEPPEDLGTETKKRRRKSKDSASEQAEPVRIKRLIPADALLIKGRHNAANALAALSLAQAAGLAMGPLLHGLREYRGEPHRVQSVAIVNDVEYVDDSKGTNVGATIAALQGLGLAHGGSSDRPRLILIAGGVGKDQDFSPLAAPIERFTKAVILIGRDAPLIKQAIARVKTQIIEASDMVEAVSAAANLAKAGDVVLLSPACASFDMFKDYAHRAHAFVEAIQELADNSHVIGGEQ